MTLSGNWTQYVRPGREGKRTFLIDHPAGWAIMPIHWSMFGSSTPEWQAATRRLYSTDLTGLDWAREMDINMEIVAGVRCYSSFSWEVNTRLTMPFDPVRPILLCCDFNVAMKAWAIVQEIHGKFWQSDEIGRLNQEATIPRMVAEFRMRYPAHPGGIEIYGDATGHNRGFGAENESAYDLITIGMRGYPSPVTIHAPLSNPPPKLRIDSINTALKGIEAEPVLFFHRERCHYAIADMLEVVYDKAGHKELQITDLEDPKHLLTHASSGLGYMMAIKRPVSKLAALLKKRQKTRRPDLQKGKRLGRL